jgi:transposase InsO family protein
MVGSSPLVNAEHTHSTGDLRLTMTSMASGRFAPFSHAGPPRSLAEIASFPRCYGTQFTSARFLATLARLGITHRRTAYHHPEGNSYIERFHRSLKEEEVWPAEYRSLEEARSSIARWLEEYNHHRPHRGVQNRTPHEAFLAFAVDLKNQALTV